jgi:hypothetical protein
MNVAIGVGPNWAEAQLCKRFASSGWDGLNCNRLLSIEADQSDIDKVLDLHRVGTFLVSPPIEVPARRRR